MSVKSPFVVSADWLESQLPEPDLKIVDASWYLPFQNRNQRKEYDDGHIPGAVFFDQDEIVEPGADLPHALPSPAVFAAHASRLGLSNNDRIVVYDGPGIFTAPRVWWMLRVMGANKVHILDGGFDNWKKEGRPVTDAVTRPAPTEFIADFDDSRLAPFSMIQSIVSEGGAQIADARSPGRFSGSEPEPREGIRSGHMPGAFNIPVMTLSDNGYLKDLEALRSAFDEAGMDLDKPVVTSCGSGVTAAAIILALESLGHQDNRLYDGSWSEWGSREDTPVDTGNSR
ncbi:3-mercaptopyruvate sulfurtransferase [Hoeflea sp. CAU 1731]